MSKQVKTPWWTWIPVVGFIGAAIQHERACTVYRLAWDAFRDGRANIGGTRNALDIVFIRYERMTKAFICTVAAVAALLLLRLFL